MCKVYTWLYTPTICPAVINTILSIKLSWYIREQITREKLCSKVQWLHVHYLTIINSLSDNKLKKNKTLLFNVFVSCLPLGRLYHLWRHVYHIMFVSQYIFYICWVLHLTTRMLERAILSAPSQFNTFYPVINFFKNLFSWFFNPFQLFCQFQTYDKRYGRIMKRIWDINTVFFYQFCLKL
jgi:hypothetical protein